MFLGEGLFMFTKIFVIIVLLISSAFTREFEQSELKDGESLIYYSPNSGRLGDCLLGFIGSKWIAYKNDLPYCFKPFRYSKALHLDDCDFTSRNIPIIQLYNSENLIKDFYSLDRKNTVYHVKFPLLRDMPPSFFYEMRQDSIFLNHIRDVISPQQSLKLIYPPKDKVSVAVHVRKGSGTDNELISEQIFDPIAERALILSSAINKNRSTDVSHPMKFPPEQYYIDQLKNLSCRLNHPQIYAYIFTDSKKPADLVNKIKKNVNLSNIQYDYNRTNTQRQTDILRDFFSIINFACLIRSGDSNFSKIAHFIGNHSLVIFPNNYHWELDIEERNYLIMEDIQVIDNTLKSF